MAAIRFGLIGMGTHGMRYARHLMHDVEGVELYAVCRQDPLRGTTFAREHNVRYYREYVDLLGDPQVDAVAVVTPHACTNASVPQHSRPVKPSWSKSPWPAQRARRLTSSKRPAVRTGC